MAYRVMKSFSIFDKQGSFRVINEGQVIDGVGPDTENLLLAGIIELDDEKVEKISGQLAETPTKEPVGESPKEKKPSAPQSAKKAK